MNKAAHIIVRGAVQGVFFRANTHSVAERLGLTGWVKNTVDGFVEIMAEGDEERLEKFIEWCHKGPPSARVTAVNVKYSGATGEFGSFRIRYF